MFSHTTRPPYHATITILPSSRYPLAPPRYLPLSTTLDHNSHLLRLQPPHLPPLLTQRANPLSHSLRRHQLFHTQQLELLSKRQEMRKERVEVRFDRQMEDLLKVRVVQMSKDAEEVFVYVLGSVRE